MSMRRVLAIARKEILHILRDRPTLGMTIGMPVIMMFLFGFAVTTDIKEIHAGLVDRDRSPESRLLIEKLEVSRSFRFVTPDASEAELRSLMDAGRIRAGLVIPPGYGASLAAGRPAPVLLLVDGSDPLVARTALPYAMLVAQSLGTSILAERLEAAGTGGRLALPIDLRTQVWYNPDLESRRFNLPGLLGVILQNVTMMLTAFAMVRERERGTIEQLIVTPVRPLELVLGKLLPYVALGFIALTTALAVTVYVFGVEPSGSLALLYALSALFLLSALGMGLFVSTVAKNQLQAMQMSQLFILPAFLLSGFIFPRESMPTAIEALGAAFPITHFLVILRGIMVKGVGLEALWPETATLAVMGAFIVILSAARFHKRLD